MSKKTKTLPTTQTEIEPITRIEGKPFLLIAAFYGLVGSLIVLGFTPDPYAAFPWFGLFYILIVLNLVFLSKVVAVVMDLMSHQGTEKGPSTRFHLCVYGGMKLFTLGAIIFSVYKGSSAPMLSMVLGLGTMVIVPLFGGIWVSQRNLEHA